MKIPRKHAIVTALAGAIPIVVFITIAEVTGNPRIFLILTDAMLITLGTYATRRTIKTNRQGKGVISSCFIVVNELLIQRAFVGHEDLQNKLMDEAIVGYRA